METNGDEAGQRVPTPFKGHPNARNERKPLECVKRIPQGPGRATWRGVCGRYPYGLVAPYFMMRAARNLTPASWEFFWVLCSLIRIDNEVTTRVASLAKTTGLSKTMIYRRLQNLSTAGLIHKDWDTRGWMINPSVFFKGRVEYQQGQLDRWLGLGGKDTWTELPDAIKGRSRRNPFNVPEVMQTSLSIID